MGRYDHEQWARAQVREEQRQLRAGAAAEKAAERERKVQEAAAGRAKVEQLNAELAHPAGHDHRGTEAKKGANPAGHDHRGTDAKKADADFKIAFARRNSRTCRSSSATRAAASVVIPGFSPSSIAARFTRPRSVSALIPNC